MIELMRFEDDGAIPSNALLPVVRATIEPAPDPLGIPLPSHWR